MRTLMLVLAVIAAAAAGCVSVQTVDPTSGGAPFENLNRAVEHRRAIIEFVDGTSRAGDRLSARADSVVWYDANRVGGRRAVPTTQVHMISVLKHGWSMGRGVLFGFVGGAVAGAVIGGSMSAETDLTMIFGAILGVLPGAAIGMGVGAAIGMVLADREDYVLVGPAPTLEESKAR